jgi:uncharacterized protein YbcV (DUF1398 family)
MLEVEAHCQAIPRRSPRHPGRLRRWHADLPGQFADAARGWRGYAVDLRRSTRTYYTTAGEALELRTEVTAQRVAERFDAAVIVAALREAQALVPGYTYKAFCTKVVGAGCAGYLVSLLGKRALYYGRTAETHTEYFPGTR